MMKWLGRIIFKRKSDANLNKDSVDAANYYFQQRGSPASMVEKQSALNYLASGYAMGYRKCEEQHGIRKPKR